MAPNTITELHWVNDSCESMDFSFLLLFWIVHFLLGRNINLWCKVTAQVTIHSVVKDWLQYWVWSTTNFGVLWEFLLQSQKALHKIQKTDSGIRKKRYFWENDPLCSLAWKKLFSVPALSQLCCMNSDISLRLYFFFLTKWFTTGPKERPQQTKSRISADVKPHITALLLGVSMPDIYPSNSFSEAWIYIYPKMYLNPKSYKKTIWNKLGF